MRKLVILVCAGLLLSGTYPIEAKASNPQAETGKDARYYNRGDKKTVKTTSRTREQNQRQINKEQKRIEREEARQQRKLNRQARKENKHGYDRNDLGEVYKGL
jgi:hypothetical protein